MATNARNAGHFGLTKNTVMKLYASIRNETGKTAGLGSNEDLEVNLYYKKSILYTLRIEYCNVGDMEKPTMDAIITYRDWRKDPEEAKKHKLKGVI